MSIYQQAKTVLQQGGIIAMPTEGVWGLSCDPNNHHAIEKLLALKQRPPEKGFILIAAMLSQLLPFVAPLPEETLAKMLPGASPITWIVPAADTIDPILSGKFNTIAVRITTHPIAKAICEAFGGALISTSANISHHPPARSIADVIAQFPVGIDLIIPGELGGLNSPTEIRDLMTDTKIR